MGNCGSTKTKKTAEDLKEMEILQSAFSFDKEINDKLLKIDDYILISKRLKRHTLNKTDMTMIDGFSKVLFSLKRKFRVNYSRLHKEFERRDKFKSKNDVYYISCWNSFHNSPSLYLFTCPIGTINIY